MHRGTSIHTGIRWLRLPPARSPSSLSTAPRAAQSQAVFFSYWSKNGPIFLTETSCLGQKMTPGRGSPWHPLPGLPAEGSLVAGPGSPCGQPTRFLAYSPWPGQPLFGAGLVNWFSCPVPVNRPGWGLTSSMCLAWPVAFLGLLEPIFVLIQTDLYLLETCWIWLKPVSSWFSWAWFPNMALELPVRQSLDSIPTIYAQREAEGPQSHRVRDREK